MRTERANKKNQIKADFITLNAIFGRVKDVIYNNGECSVLQLSIGFTDIRLLASLLGRIGIFMCSVGYGNTSFSVLLAL